LKNVSVDQFPIVDEQIVEGISCGLDIQLAQYLRETVNVLKNVVEKGYNHWVIAYSGGKDSTLVAIIVAELLQRGVLPDSVQVEIILGDTLVEIPPMATFADMFLNEVKKNAQASNLPIQVHKTIPPTWHRYWFLVIGKGYPPPHNRFRWCTDRLKILPTARLIKERKNEHTVILTGVRFGESDSRTGRLRASACTNDNECGIGLWIEKSSQMGTYFVAPIAHWRTCKVWDFHYFVAPQLGWPTVELGHLYGNDSTRFGCWTCTLIGEDKALAAVTKQVEWSHFKALGHLRDKLQRDARKPENRLQRPNGYPGRLKISYRRALLDELRRLEEEVGTELIAEDEIDAIYAYWETEEKYGPYSSQCKFWRPG
jgi:DNA sulfur modification protein DndC